MLIMSTARDSRRSKFVVGDKVKFKNNVWSSKREIGLLADPLFSDQLREDSPNQFTISVVMNLQGFRRGDREYQLAEFPRVVYEYELEPIGT